MMRWLMCLVWAAYDFKHPSAGRSRKHLHRRTAPEDFSLSVSYYKEHWGKVSAAHSCTGGWDEIYQRSPKEIHRVNLQPAQMQKTHTQASYIMFNKSDHVQLLQHVEHLSLTSLLQLFTAQAPRDRWRREKKGAFIPTQEFPCFGKCKLEHYY